MSMSNTFETELLELILNNVAIADIGDVAGLPKSVTNGSLYVALHIADPGEGGNQSTSEANYTGYARVAVARNPSSKKWTVASGSASNAEAIAFPAATAGSNTITHVSVGVASSGATKYLYSGALSSSLAVSSGITPSIAIGAATITLD